jgi:hypothetical protein
MPVVNRLRPHVDSIDGCQLKSQKQHFHLFDHLSTEYGGLPTTKEEVSTLRQEPFLVLSCGLTGPDTRIPALRTAHTACRWVYSRAGRLLQVSAAYASLVLDDRYLVYPEDWHPEIRVAFGLEDPPTPTEVFSLFHTMYVPYHREMKKSISMHEACLLDYYCLGAQIPALAACYRVTDEHIIWLLAQTIKQLMSNLTFSLWASGADLTPMMTTWTTRVYMANIMGQGKGARATGDIWNTSHAPTAKRELDAIRHDNPYYAMIVREGLRLSPIQRAFTTTRWAWSTAEKKHVKEDQEWYILYALRHRALNHWMRLHLMGKKVLLPTTKIRYPLRAPKKGEEELYLTHPTTYDAYKELAELYGKGTIDEAAVARLRTKWEDAFYAKAGRYPGYGAGRRFTGISTN